jgi:hypothetical protein
MSVCLCIYQVAEHSGLSWLATVTPHQRYPILTVKSSSGRHMTIPRVIPAMSMISKLGSGVNLEGDTFLVNQVQVTIS